MEMEHETGTSKWNMKVEHGIGTGNMEYGTGTWNWNIEVEYGIRAWN